MTYTTAALFTLAAQCAPNVSQQTVVAIIKTESGGNPFAINVNGARQPPAPTSAASAAATARRFIAAGYSVDLGLGQINSRNMRWLGLTWNTVFDPCTNISAGAKVLTHGYQKTGSLPAALSMYNTGKPNSTRGQEYARQVLRHAGVVVPAPAGGRMANLPALKVETRRDPTAPESTAAAAPSATLEPISVAVSPQASDFSPSWR